MVPPSCKLVNPAISSMKPSESGVTATEQFPTHKLFLPLPWFLRPMAMDGFFYVAGEVVVKGQRWEMQLKASG